MDAKPACGTSLLDTVFWCVGAITVPVVALNVARAHGLIKTPTKEEEARTDAVFDLVVLPVGVLVGAFLGGRALWRAATKSEGAA